jgi:hypothetical protein
MIVGGMMVRLPVPVLELELACGVLVLEPVLGPATLSEVVTSSVGGAVVSSKDSRVWMVSLRRDVCPWSLLGNDF